jgi:CRP-like cAMP-binding protein
VLPPVERERWIVPNRNALIGALSPQDAATLKPYLHFVSLADKRILYDPGDEITNVYFPTTAVISLVAVLSNGEMIEAAMVGRDGVVGAAAALNGKVSFSRTVVQLPGDAFACSVDALAHVAFLSRPLLSLLIKHEQTVYAQAQQSTACMAAHDVQERLCRWLLRARDLAGSDKLPFTQEFLAEMLGVRRTSVSPAARAFQQAGLIKYVRGRIEILDVEGLQEGACECYSAIKAEYRKLVE